MSEQVVKTTLKMMSNIDANIQEFQILRNHLESILDNYEEDNTIDPVEETKGSDDENNNENNNEEEQEEQRYDAKELCDRYTYSMELGKPNGVRDIYRRATKMLISNLINHEDRKQITLKELYQGLNAQTEDDGKNGVRWGVRDAKDIYLIRKTDQRGIYSVC
jgi:hypothetical protein